VSVTDPNTGLLPTNLTQAGVAVTWLTADANSRYSFTCDVPGVVVDFGAGAQALYANEVPGLAIAAGGATNTAIDTHLGGNATNLIATVAGKLDSTVASSTYVTAFLPSKYGTVDTTGATDSSAAILACIAAAAVGGGVVQLPSGTIRCDSQVTIPHDAATPVKQASITIRGTGQLTNGLIAAGLTSGTILDLRYSGTGAKIFTCGRGTLVMEDLTLTDYGTSSTPFVLSTGTTFMPNRVTVIGNPTKAGATCDQDAFVFGGGTFALNDASYNACYSGYGSSVKNCYFDRIRRGIYGRSAFNAFYAANNGWSINCGGDATVGPVDIDGTGSDGDSGNVFINQIIEMSGYVYGYKFNASRNNIILGGGLYDGPSTLAGVRLEGLSTGSTIVGTTWGGLTPDKYVSDAVGTNTPTIIGKGQYGGPALFTGGAGQFTVQPALATGVEASKLLRVARSTLEATNPNIEVFNVKQDGTVGIGSGSGTTVAALTIANTAGNVTLDHTSIVKATGDYNIYAGTGASDCVRIMRGTLQVKAFTTAARPAANAKGAGTMYYDTTVSKPVWSDGTTWRDAAGTAV
jgi:hypothetical protein